MHLDPRHPAHAAARADKIVSAAEAVRLIHDGDTVATGGFVGIGFAEGIAVALEQRFLAGRRGPHGLTLVYAAGQGDGKDSAAQPPGPRGPGAARGRRPLGAGARLQALAVATASRPGTCRRA
jgi:propionate CoA-transferase